MNNPANVYIWIVGALLLWAPSVFGQDNGSEILIEFQENDADAPTGAIEPASEIPKQVVGWVENVLLENSDMEVKAKFDTGAATSSLDVRYTRMFRLNGVRMVRFEIENPESGERVSFERPVVRMVRIKQHGGGYLRRPVVHMRVCIGTNPHEVEISLADRSNFVYPMLLGRSALQGVAIVDPQTTFAIKPHCEDADLYE